MSHMTIDEFRRMIFAMLTTQSTPAEKETTTTSA